MHTAPVIPRLQRLLRGKLARACSPPRPTRHEGLSSESGGAMPPLSPFSRPVMRHLVLAVVLGFGLMVPASLFNMNVTAERNARADCPADTVPIPGTDLCTHGPDPAPPGLDEDTPVRLQGKRVAAAATDPLACDGDGTSGYRVQVLYVRGNATSSRYTQVLPNIRSWVSQIDTIVATNAQQTGGARHVRWVHDRSCVPMIPEVVIADGSVSGFGSMISAIQQQGYNRTDRVYLLFGESTVYCGIGSFDGDNRPGSDNASNTGPAYARVDAGCWSATAATHELWHNLGAVNNSAPNASGGAHCIDEYDIMCYSDSPNHPTMRFDCSDRAGNGTMLDCNHNDYFNVSPRSGSYLDTHWNTANSRFLVQGNEPPPPTSTPPPPTRTPVPPTATSVPPTKTPVPPTRTPVPPTTTPVPPTRTPVPPTVTPEPTPKPCPPGHQRKGTCDKWQKKHGQDGNESKKHGQEGNEPKKHGKEGNEPKKHGKDGNRPKR